MAMIFCYECGKKISDKASVCPHCGAAQKGEANRALIALILAFFLGCFGVHRFYVGKTGSGLAMLLISLTFVGLIVTGIWALIDIIMIVCGMFTDKDGKELKF